MEARRAQGFRDDDVLLGLPADQYRIVGNSVAREVAVALGAVFREAWVQSLADEDRGRAVAASAGLLPAATGTEACPLVIQDPPSSESCVDTEPEDLARLRSSRSQTPTASMTPTPPPSDIPHLSSSGSNKRARSSSLAVEIHVPKLPNTARGESPGQAAAARYASANRGVIEPSPLGQTVIILDEE